VTTASRIARIGALPVAAVALVAAVLGVQVASGGGRFEPLRPADPCVARPVSAPADTIDGLTADVVLIGIDEAACRLHVTREALTLQLAGGGTPSDAQIAALHAGLLAAVRRMKADGTLPPASALVDQALESLDINPLLKAAIKALPDSVIDAALKTDDVLDRTIDDLDLRTLLANLNDGQGLDQQIQSAVTQAIKQSLSDRLHGLL
jgi:hypothetical protein